MTPLRKSARRYLALVARLPTLTADSVRSGPYRDCADYARALYHEFGRDRVRREIENVRQEMSK